MSLFITHSSIHIDTLVSDERHWFSLIYKESLFTVIGPLIHWLEQLFIIGYSGP